MDSSEFTVSPTHRTPCSKICFLVVLSRKGNFLPLRVMVTSNVNLFAELFYVSNLILGPSQN